MTPDRSTLEAHDCWFLATDRVAGQADVTAFKQQARLHQAMWREQRGYPVGSQPMKPKADGSSRRVGSRIDLDFAMANRVNLLSDAALVATLDRLATPQPHQTLNPQRLWADLLSSMPMCFNLFGPLATDPRLAEEVLSGWFSDVIGSPVVHLEWSPGRCNPGFLDNRTAFDAAIEFDRGDGSLGVIGIETKYHEHSIAEKAPSAQRMIRYVEVTEASGVFHDGAIEQIVGTDLQQIWLDHLLVLSMLQHRSGRWSRGKYVLVHPAGNPSFARLADRYRTRLVDDRSFDVVTLEELLAAEGPMPAELREPARRAVSLVTARPAALRNDGLASSDCVGRLDAAGADVASPG